MRQVLTNPDAGYYTTPSSLSKTEVFGKKGDFITSPEITQVFGELVGIWTITEWMAQGRPQNGVELIEVGPGKGTLMDDILRVSRKSHDFKQRERVPFVGWLTDTGFWSRQFAISRVFRQVSRLYILSKLVHHCARCRRICSVAQTRFLKRLILVTKV